MVRQANYHLLTFVVLLSTLQFLSCESVTKWVAPFFISEEQEVKLGNRFKQEILSDTENSPPFEGDERVTQFVDSLGQRIAGIRARHAAERDDAGRADHSGSSSRGWRGRNQSVARSVQTHAQRGRNPG